MVSVLFVCTANQFRSPIAAACFNRKMTELSWKREWTVSSAGVWATHGKPPLPEAEEVASKLGLSLEGHLSTMVTPVLVSVNDLIMVMEKGQKEAMQNEFSVFRSRIFLLSEVVDNSSYDIQDPIAEGSERCLEVGTQIFNLVDKGFYRICNRALRQQKIYNI
jgi:protein-tyrosine phosphatase